MARKQKFEGGTKNRIVEIGGKMFLENGYDGTGIRAIMDRVGADVGVFYYYFNTKDDLFAEVLDRFMEPYRTSLSQLVSAAEVDPVRGLYQLFDYFSEAVADFRAKYAENLHRTVKWAIDAHALNAAEPYVGQILAMIAERGATPAMEPATLAVYLTHAVGSCILKEDPDWVHAVVKPQLMRSVDLLLGLPVRS